jgi:hypothetical protein
MAIEEIAVPVRSRIWTDEDAKNAFALLSDGKAAKYGEYEGENAESKARTQGMALDRLIKANHGRRFGVSVWKNADGKFVGALLPREPVARKAKAKAKANAKRS